MRWMFVIAAAVLLAAPVFGDAVALDALPAAVQDSLKNFLENPQEKVDHIDSYVWGPAVIYKISIYLSGQPYLEVHIADTGQVLRSDEDPAMAAKEDQDGDDSSDASPTPR
jgi:hypothetical protein